MNVVKQIIQLHQAQVPIKGISRQLGLSKNTVKGYLSRFFACGHTVEHLLTLEGPELHAALSPGAVSERERYAAFMENAERYVQELATHKHLTRLILWEEEYKAGRIHYQYSRFCHYLSLYTRSRNGSMIMPHSPGQKAFMDFAGDKLYITDVHSGKLTPCEVLITTLGYSNYTAISAVRSQKIDDVLDGMTQCLEAIAGVSEAVVLDNFKAAVTKADRYEPVINERFLDFANHYGFAVLTTRVRKPKDKAKVEGAVNHIYHQVYARIRHQSFYSLEELNHCLRELCREFNDRIMKEYGLSRSALLERDERAMLKELPQQPYAHVYQYKLKVTPNNHVQIRKLQQYYSVPYRFIGQHVTVLVSTKLVKVYYRGECIATHIVAPGKYRSHPDHMGSAHKAYLDSINPDKLRESAAAVSPQVLSVIEKVLSRSQFPEQNYKSCQGILSLAGKVGGARLTECCRIALEAERVTYTYIKRLSESPYTMVDPDPQKSGPLPVHENLRMDYV